MNYPFSLSAVSRNKTPLEAYQDQLQRGVLSPDPHQESAMRSLQRLYDELKEAPAKNRRNFLKKKPAALKGIYLYGGVGRGKSMLMDMFYDCLPGTFPARRVHFHEFMIEVHDYLHQIRTETNKTNKTNKTKEGNIALPKLARKIARESRVLCFDEFHVTDIADAMILGRLFTSLFEQGVIMVATSNWPPEMLYDGGLQRNRFLPFIDLLTERLEIVKTDGGTDYRLQYLSDGGVYFWPLGKGAGKQADAVFDKLTNGTNPYEETLTVKGRTFVVERVAQGVARFTFAQLCEQPHGAEDYLSVARAYHTVFVETVPKLGYDRRNEAKRLMTLIDALYEQGVKLVITADAPPDRLYQGRDHAFEFQRTVSRLMEMQSKDYLSRKNA